MTFSQGSDSLKKSVFNEWESGYSVYLTYYLSPGSCLGMKLAKLKSICLTKDFCVLRVCHTRSRNIKWKIYCNDLAHEHFVIHTEN